MKLSFIAVGISLPLLSACGGGNTEQTFSEKFSQEEAFFAHVQTEQSRTLVAALPTGQAVYSGVMSMTIDVDGVIDTDETVTDPGGDFRAIGDLVVNVDFGVGVQTLSGTVSNFQADEGKDLSGSLTISSTGLTGATFPATYGGTLTLDTSDLIFSAGTISNGEFKGANGDFIIGGHNSTVDWLGQSGGPIGSVSGRIIGTIQ